MDDAAMVELPAAQRRAPDQPRPSIETLLHAFVPAPHVDHTHPDAVIALTSTPDGPAARRGDVRRRGRLARLPAARASTCRGGSRVLLGEQPAARAVLLEKHGLVTWGETGEESYAVDARVRLPCRRAHRAARRRPVRAGRPEGRGPRGRARRRTARGVAAGASRRAARGRRGVVLEVDRSPEAVAFASSARAPEVSQIGAPCPDHLINTKHRPLVVDFDPDARRRGRARAAVPARRRGVRRLVPRVLRRQSRRRDAARSRSTRRGRAWCSSPASASSPRLGCGSRKGRARSLPPRDRGGERCRRARRFPLAQRGRGVRDRVLAARALQARAGAAARRARRPGRADHRRRERDRSRIGAAACRARRARRRRGPQLRRRAEVAEEIVAANGVRRAVAVTVDVTDEEAVSEMMRRDGARIRRPRHPRLLGRARRQRARDRDDARRLGPQLRRARRGYFLAAREAFRVLLAAGRAAARRLRRLEERARRGSERRGLLVGQGGGAPPRALPRRGGRRHGIRVNTVNPDAVIEGSSIWSSRWKAERASTYGVAEDELPTSTGGGRSSASTSPRGRRRGNRILRRPALGASRPETSSTSTAASPPPIPDDAKEAHHRAVVRQPNRERNH